LSDVKAITLPPEDADGQTETVYHLFVIRLPNSDVRDGLARALKEKGIETGVHYPVPNHQQPAIEEIYGKLLSLPKTEDYVKRILSLPMYPALEQGQVKIVCEAIKTFLRR
jgi:dTDP-4-amino-4,6-dideoxygalactose transaminase